LIRATAFTFYQHSDMQAFRFRSALSVIAALLPLWAHAADPTLVQPLTVGTEAPVFVARNPDGSDYRFDATAREAPAVPAVFVVDRAGTIRFAHFNPDFRLRLSAEELLAAAPPID